MSRDYRGRDDRHRRDHHDRYDPRYDRRRDLSPRDRRNKWSPSPRREDRYDRRSRRDTESPYRRRHDDRYPVERRRDNRYLEEPPKRRYGRDGRDYDYRRDEYERDRMRRDSRDRGVARRDDYDRDDRRRTRDRGEDLRRIRNSASFGSVNSSSEERRRRRRSRESSSESSLSEAGRRRRNPSHDRPAPRPALTQSEKLDDANLKRIKASIMARRGQEGVRVEEAESGSLNQASLLPPLGEVEERPNHIADIKQRILESRLKRQEGRN